MQKEKMAFKSCDVNFDAPESESSPVEEIRDIGMIIVPIASSAPILSLKYRLIYWYTAYTSSTR